MAFGSSKSWVAQEVWTASWNDIFFIIDFNVQDFVRDDILYKNGKSHLAGTRLGMKSKFEAQTFKFDKFLWFVDLLLFW